jgi:hypothetical protein
MAKVKDLSGQKFGRLTVLSFSHVEKSKAFSRAMCECGVECVVSNNRMQCGYVQSCGCLRFKPGAAERELYGKYVKRARERGFPLEFNFESFITFVQQDCFYCGTGPSQIIESFNAHERFVYNGIDRWNNAIGYTKENTVPCCGDCNRQKLTQSGEEFLERCKKVASRADDLLAARLSVQGGTKREDICNL